MTSILELWSREWSFTGGTFTTEYCKSLTDTQHSLKDKLKPMKDRRKGNFNGNKH